MSCIYGPRQMGTEDQGWVAHFLIRALARRADHHLRRRPAGARHPVRRRRRRRLCRGLAQHRAREGPRVQSRRRPRQCDQPADPARLHRRAARPSARRCAIRIGAPGDQRYYVSNTRAIESELSLRRSPALGEKASHGCWTGSAARRRTPQPSRPSGGGRMRVALVNPQMELRRTASISAAASRICRWSSALAGRFWRRRDTRRACSTAPWTRSSNRALAEAVAAFRPDMTVVTTAPTYLFWRCAPPELRAPRDFLVALAERGGRTRRRRAARIGDASDGLEEARRRRGRARRV